MEEISQSEIQSLQWMREEEMLAHDVYLSLSEQFSVPVFANIARSEMRHTTAVAGLLERYGLEDEKCLFLFYLKRLMNLTLKRVET